MEAYEQRRKTQAVDEAHDPVDVVIMLDHFADDRVVDGGDTGAERDHQGAHLLRHVDALLKEGDQTGQHGRIGETENGERQMRDPERMFDEKIDHHVCDEHHRDVQVDHLAGSGFHRDENVHESAQAVGEIDDAGNVGGARFGQVEGGLEQEMLRVEHRVRLETELKSTAAQEQSSNQVVEAERNGRIFRIFEVQPFSIFAVQQSFLWFVRLRRNESG